MSKIFILLLACYLFLSVASQAEQSSSSKGSFDGGLTPDNVSKFIADQQIHDVDSLLSRMPQRLLSNFTLAYRSQSIQSDCVSKKNPRVILFSQQDDFVMAVTGNLKPGCGNVEMMQFDQSSRRFTFREYTFDRNSAASAPKNSSSCISCHGADSRPIWASYPNWPGFFGNEASTDGDAGEQPGEFLKLKSAWINQAVYRQLKWGDPQSMYPYTNDAESITLRPNFRLGLLLNRENAKRLQRVYEETPGYLAYRYQIESMLLSCPISDSDPMAKSKNSQKIRMEDKSLDEVRPGNIFKPDWFDMKRLDVQAGDPEIQDTDFTDGGSTTSELVAASIMDGIAASDHSLDHPFASYTQRASVFDQYAGQELEHFSPAQQLEEEIFPESLSHDLKWIDEKGEVLSLGGNLPAVREEVCNRLQKKFNEMLSDSAFASVINTTPYETANSPDSNNPSIVDHLIPQKSAQVFSSCIECHNGGGSAKRIPFGNDQALRSALNESGYAHGSLANEILWRIDLAPLEQRMPYGASLTDEEAAAIHRFVDLLSR